ncbi:hypothetical protein [Lelliottia amnigena]|nr:hypothetical protein [Lelliottia amnigena]MCU7782392.1 hypothetical protein [Lelliottia amnigena]
MKRRTRIYYKTEQKAIICGKFASRLTALATAPMSCSASRP